MGYNLYITRRLDRLDENSGPAIALEEFREAVSHDSELVLTNDPEQDAAIWQREDMWWDEGQVTSKSPSEEFRKVMFRIAVKLGARVVGDDDEEYGPDGKAIPSEPAPASVNTDHAWTRPSKSSSTAWIRLLLGGFLVGSIALLVAWLTGLI